MKNKYVVPKLKSRQEVFDHICRTMQDQEFQLAEATPGGKRDEGQYIAFVGDNGARSPVGCLFDAKKLDRKINFNSIQGHDTRQIVFKLIRKAQGLPKDQKLDKKFLMDIEEAGETLYHDKEKGIDWMHGRADYIKRMNKLARTYRLKPYEFSDYKFGVVVKNVKKIKKLP
jgi:hypothetical protein